MTRSFASRIPAFAALSAVFIVAACDDSGTNSLTNTPTTSGTNACADRMITTMDVTVTPTAERNYVIEIVTKSAAGKPITGAISVGFLGDRQPPTALTTADNKENRLFSVVLPDDTLTTWIVAVSNGCSSAFGNLTLPDPGFGDFSIDVAFHADPGVAGSVLYDTVSQREAPGRFYRAPILELRDPDGRKLTAITQTFEDGGAYLVHAKTVTGRTVATVHDLSPTDAEPELVIINAAVCSQITKPIGLYALRSGVLLGGKTLETGESARVPWRQSDFVDAGLALGFDVNGDGEIDAYRERPAPLDLFPESSDVVVITCRDAEGQTPPLSTLSTLHLSRWHVFNANGLITDRIRYGLESGARESVDLGTTADQPPFAADFNVPLSPQLDASGANASLIAKIEEDCSIAEVAVLIGVQQALPSATYPARMALEHDGVPFVFAATQPKYLQWVTAHTSSSAPGQSPLIGESSSGTWTVRFGDPFAVARLAIRCKAE